MRGTTSVDSAVLGMRAGPYVSLLRLAQGGMGDVHLSVRREGSFQRLYVVKRLRDHLRGDPELVAMFMEEARVAGLLRHPNVVSVLDVGRDSDGPYLVMDYVDGIAVSELIPLAGEGRPSLPVQICLRIIADAARGLHAAHELRGPGGEAQELIHRDISPQNLLIGSDGVCRVTDFGIAKSVGGNLRTSTGLLKGKIGYMAPERLRFRGTDRRSDLFALGVVLYELLSGARLYGGGAESSAYSIVEGPLPDIGMRRDDVPDAIVELLFELLAKEPDERPASAAEVAERIEAEIYALAMDEGPLELGEFVEGLAHEELQARSSDIKTALDTFAQSECVRPPKQKPRRRFLAALAALVCLALVLWFGFSTSPSSNTEAPSLDPVLVTMNRASTVTAFDGSVDANVTEGEVADASRRQDAVNPAKSEASPPQERNARRKKGRKRAATQRRRPKPVQDGTKDVPHWGWW